MVLKHKNLYYVGGVVRDEILGAKSFDTDFCYEGDAIEFANREGLNVIKTNPDFGTVRVLSDEKEIDIASTRTETYPRKGHLPKVENIGCPLKEDLIRRDFTINAIAADLKNGKIVDPFGGRRDIKKKVIRTVGKAHDRFMEDGLRPVRCVRFACKLGFSIEKYTFSELFDSEIRKKIGSISIERFRDEFDKILASAKPSVGLKLLEETGMTSIFIPELLEGRGCVQSDQRGFHDFDVLDHLYYACDGATVEKPNVRLAALFHDIGKPAAKKIIDGNITFYNHERIGSKLTQQILTRLKYPNAVIDDVCHLINEHMFNYESNWTVPAVRRFIIRVGQEHLEDLFDLRLADMYGMHNQPIEYKYSAAINLLVELKDRISVELEKNNALSLKDLAINGNDLIAAGFEKGKKLGLILNHLLDCVIEDPGMNTKDKLLEVAKSL